MGVDTYTYLLIGKKMSKDLIEEIKEFCRTSEDLDEDEWIFHYDGLFSYNDKQYFMLENDGYSDRYYECYKLLDSDESCYVEVNYDVKDIIDVIEDDYKIISFSITI